MKASFLFVNPFHFCFNLNWPCDIRMCNTKELSLWNKIKYLNLNIFWTRCCKPLIFQTQIICSNIIHSLKYLRSETFGSKDILIRKSEFVAKTQLLYNSNLFFRLHSDTVLPTQYEISETTERNLYCQFPCIHGCLQLQTYSLK